MGRKGGCARRRLLLVGLEIIRLDKLSHKRDENIAGHMWS